MPRILINEKHKTMKNIILGAMALLSTTCATAQTFADGGIQIKIRNHIGRRIDTCIERRVKAQDTDELIAPFRQYTEGGGWQMEFIGKWMLGACASYAYSHDAALRDKISDAARKLMATQAADGYIGNYKASDRLTNWDIWGRKYVALGLLAYYKLSADSHALTAVGRLIDSLMHDLDATGTDIAATGNYFGMASCSVLEPVVYLYKATGEKRYLDFARSIVTSIERDGHAQLIAKALDGVPVYRRSAYPKSWWSYENGQKAYEMMSCYEGLVELGNVLHDPLYLQVAERTAASIIENEINIAGSGAAFECWYEGKKNQILPAYHTMETCVTFTWMQFCARLLRNTGNSMYADTFERTMYNALMASMRSDGGQISKYSPLEGRRVEGENQCGLHINCCNANGPRGFALIPQTAYTVRDSRIDVNLYLDSEASLRMGKNLVGIDMQTRYPLDGKVHLVVNPRRSEAFAIALRIPSWVDSGFTVLLNGVEQPCLHKGGYFVMERKWAKGDIIDIDFRLKTKVQTFNHHQAVTHGPLVFARDSRFADGDVDECAVVKCDADGTVEARLTDTDDSSFAWITMEVPAVLGTDLEGDDNKAVRWVKFCDFASAGNDWNKGCRYRVWIPKTLHQMSEPYHKY